MAMSETYKYWNFFNEFSKKFELLSLSEDIFLLKRSFMSMERKKSVKISNLLVILAITCPKTNRSKYRYNNINSFQSNYTVYLSRLSIIFPIHPLKQYKTKNIWEKWSHIKTYSNTCEWRPLLRLSILAISFVAYGTWIAAYKTHTQLIHHKIGFVLYISECIDGLMVFGAICHLFMATALHLPTSNQ